jgi:hypothetical protein
MSPFALQAILVASAGALLGVVVARLTRMRAISFRFTLAWAVIALVAVASALLIPLVEPVARILALSPAAVLTAVVTVVLVSIALQLSVSVSGLQDQVRDIAEMQALSVEWATAAAPRGADRTLVVVPAWNEGQTVGRLVSEIAARGLDVVVIDDGSTDHTAAEAAKAGATVLRMPTNLGVGAALRAGFRFAVTQGYERVVQCDGDGQHPVAAIGRLLDEQANIGCDLLVASRFACSEPPAIRLSWVRRFAMKVLARSASKAAGTVLTDASSGFRVICRPLLDELGRELPSHYLADTYETLVAAGRAGYRIAETPVALLERQYGDSSASPAAAFKFTIRVLAVVAMRSHFAVRPRQEVPPW